MFGGTIQVAVSQSDLAYAEATLSAIKNGATIACKSAVNDTLRHGRTNMVRLMREYLNLPAKEIRHRITIRQRATTQNPTGVIAIDYKFVPLLAFYAKYARKSGVTVTQIKGESAQIFRHQFRQMMHSGHVGLFERRPGEPKVVPQKGTYAGRILVRGPNAGKLMTRQPIHETFGVSVLRAFELNQNLQNEAMQDLTEYLHARLMSKIDWQLERGDPNIPDSTDLPEAA